MQLQYLTYTCVWEHKKQYTNNITLSITRDKKNKEDLEYVHVQKPIEEVLKRIMMSGNIIHNH